jgi:hypothetical protein
VRAGGAHAEHRAGRCLRVATAAREVRDRHAARACHAGRFNAVANLPPPEPALTAERAKRRQYAGIGPPCHRFGVDPERISDETGRKDVAVVVVGFANDESWSHSRFPLDGSLLCWRVREALPEGVTNLGELGRREPHSGRHAKPQGVVVVSLRRQAS